MDQQLTKKDLQAGLEALGNSPEDKGTLEMIVCRPDTDERKILEQAKLDLKEGMIGDNWLVRGSRHTEDGSAHPEQQITLMNSRVVQLLSGDRERWSLAGDQLYVDLDLSAENLPPGQQLAIGSAIVEVSKAPHTGCKKFTERFGSEATRFVNSKEGRQQRRGGINARVVQAGTIHMGDTVSKID